MRLQGAIFSRLGVLLAGAVACGGSSSAASSDGGPDSAVGIDGATGPDAEAGALTGDSLCRSMASQAACQSCCNTMHPDAGQEFFGDTMACACQSPSLCAPLAADPASDAAVGDAAATGGDDGGPAGFGEGACSAATCAQEAPPSAGCTQCVSMTLQSPTGLGPCAIAASSTCSQSPTCAAIVSCAAACP